MAVRGDSKGARERAAVRRGEALELRMSGLRYRQIAAQLGVSAQQIHRDVTKALLEVAALSEEDAEAVRELETQRLDTLLTAHWDEAIGGDRKATECVLRILTRRAKMLGIDTAASVRNLNLDLDLNQLTDEQLERIVDGEDPARVLAATAPSSSNTGTETAAANEAES